MIEVTELKPFAPQTWPFDLDDLPLAAYLVGGSVRDALMGRQGDYLDLDFVLPAGAIETASAIARRCKAGFVILDAERQIARVVFERATADFALQEGATLEIDLQRRDFTVNAIAYNPHTGQLIDPLRGHTDLQKGILRMVAAKNLRDDPLRLLRAYRQAAQLGFSLEPETQLAIRELAPRLALVAAERVQSELFYLLRSPAGTPWLTTAWQDGLFQDWLPHATAINLARVAEIDRLVLIFQEHLPAFSAELVRPLRETAKSLGGDRTYLNTIKLAALLSRVPAAAEQELLRLKVSRNQLRAIVTVLETLPQLHPDLPLSLRDQYFLFQTVGSALPVLAVLALADGVSLTAIQPLIERFLTPDDPVAHPIPLITGRDLMQRFRLTAGPHIGQLLTEIQVARAEGKIVTREDALLWAEGLLEKSSGLT